MRRLLTAAAAAAVAMITVPPAAAAPMDLCGMGPVSGHVTLTTDLTCDAGLTATGDVHIDLAGHAFTGPGAGTAIELIPPVRLTLAGGIMDGWETGISLSGDGETAVITVVETTFTATGTAISAMFADVTIDRSQFTDNHAGIAAMWSSLRVAATRFHRNDVALRVGGAPAWITGSTFTDNSTGAYCSDSGFRVSSSTFRGNQEAVVTSMCGSVPLTDNTFRDNGIAYRSNWFQGQDQILRNAFTGNEVAIDAGAPALLAGNSFTRNGVGVRAPDEWWIALGLDGNEFRRNGDAVVIESTVTLRNTLAIQNAGWGIYAPKATDLGGNIAYRNGNDPQCVGVTCEGGPGKR